MNHLEGILALLSYALQNYNPNGDTRVGAQQVMPSPNGAGVNVQLGRGNFPGQQILEHNQPLPRATLQEQPGVSPYDQMILEHNQPLPRATLQEQPGVSPYDQMMSQYGGGALRQDELLRALIPGLMRGGM